MTHTVIGFFRNSDDAYHASDVLKDRGFDNKNIDVSSNSENLEKKHDEGERTGKIGNFFKSLFGDDDENANMYSGYASKNSLVTVHAVNHDEAERAASALDECGALDIDDKNTDSDYKYSERSLAADTYSESGLASDMNYDLADSDSLHNHDQSTDMDLDSDLERSGSFTSDKDRNNTSEASIPIIEEEVSVGKREVRRGGVRVKSRIIEKPIEENLRLREERVTVQRNPADREATPTELENFREETIEIDEYAEEPVISKRTRVVEEVKVGKEVHERDEKINETERKTEVDIENLDEEYERSHRKG